MAQDTITAHIKLPDTDWQILGNHARNHDLTTAQLVRRIIRKWLDSQVIVDVVGGNPITAQALGHPGYKFTLDTPDDYPGTEQTPVDLTRKT